MINKKEITDCFKIAGISKTQYKIEKIIHGAMYKVILYPTIQNFGMYDIVPLFVKYFKIDSDLFMDGLRILLLSSQLKTIDI